MHPSDSHESGIPHRAAGVLLCTVLALLFWAGADRLIGIERGYYDLFQRLTASPAEAPVLIIDTGKADANPWLMPRFDEVLLRAKASGRHTDPACFTTTGDDRSTGYRAPAGIDCAGKTLWFPAKSGTTRTS